LALGKTPAGFVKSKLLKSVATNPQMLFETQNKFVGSTYDIYSYKLVSVSDSPLELSEETFYSPAVRAVAFYPLAMLQKGETTMVYVIADHTGAAN
jgi:conjugal transfer pilus assembly protein TraK